MPSDPKPEKLIATLRAALPASPFPSDRDGPLTPHPFPLTKKQLSELEKIGHRLFLFHQALDRLHRRSAAGKLPAWIAECLGARGALPSVFCPELTLTEAGWSLTGFGSVARVLPATAWLNQTYASLCDDPIVAGPDWDEITILAGQALSDTDQSAPDIPFALLHLRSLREIWRRELRDSQFQRLEKLIPYTWLMDPAPLPPQAVIPRLNLNAMRAVAGLPRDKRGGLVLKSKDRTLFGRDATDDEWRAAVARALDATAAHAHILQEVVEPAVAQHPVWDAATNRIETRALTIHLTPIYVTGEKTAPLAGLLATLKTGADTILAPCSVS